MVRHATAIGMAIITSATLYASDMAERFHRTYASLRSLSCTFTDPSGLKGSIQAVKGGKYRLQLPDRVMVSDGRSVWNATSSTKTVIINALQSGAATTDDLSIERVFFTLLAVYRVQHEQQARGLTTLRLVPPSPTATVGGVEWADVVVDKAMSVRSITVHDASSTTSWTITQVRRNPSIAASTFSYVPPSNWQIIDLR